MIRASGKIRRSTSAPGASKTRSLSSDRRSGHVQLQHGSSHLSSTFPWRTIVHRERVDTRHFSSSVRRIMVSFCVVDPKRPLGLILVYPYLYLCIFRSMIYTSIDLRVDGCIYVSMHIFIYAVMYLCIYLSTHLCIYVLYLYFGVYVTYLCQ